MKAFHHVVKRVTFIIIFESVMINSQITKKPSLPTQRRALHSHKSTHQSNQELAQARNNSNPSNSNDNRPALKGFIQLIPSDQGLIEQYIEELRQKLQQIRASPKRKCSRLQTEQIFKRKYSEESRTKSKVKSNEGYRISTDEAADTNTAKKSALLDFRQARDDFKRSKQMAERRVVTEKENHRYSAQKSDKTASKNQPVTQSCELRIRSNTEVLRSQKNPARFYRYSSLKKTPCMQEANHHLFHNIISLHHNVNIHLAQHSPNQRLRRELNQEVRQVEAVNGARQSPAKQKAAQTEKIGDLSTINARKETLNFLGQSCVQLKEQLQQGEEKEVSKILDFLGWKTNEMKKALSNIKQKKRKNGLDKLGKIFPKGFFP